MKSFLYILLATFIFSINSFSQTSLAGKVTDAETGESILFGNVILYKGGNFLTGVPTDIDGFYNFANIAPGIYDVVVSYVGYNINRINGVSIYGEQANKLDIKVEMGETINDTIVRSYDVPPNKQNGTLVKFDYRGCRTPTAQQLITIHKANLIILNEYPIKKWNYNQTLIRDTNLTENLPSRKINNTTIQNLLDLQVKTMYYQSDRLKWYAKE